MVKNENNQKKETVPKKTQDISEEKEYDEYENKSKYHDYKKKNYNNSTNKFHKKTEFI